ncbi:MAG TPA: HPr family phosphocarrier protein [Elusimicrobia bacterium]|nr:HPr family phosphocarrier protein [Elusimicrobiota bacterium]
MKKKTLAITPKLGLHARPASLFVQTSSRFQADVKVSKLMDGEEVVVNGKSVMGLMMLAAAFGEKVQITVDGPDEEAALAKIEELFRKKFDED